ncbi:hypothetical protein FOPG_19586 [Fusarium oxysporum f. sp. conglutinans race 2 54008]|uniref:Uncharacterized protein n=1 Tax=Fusarium oxysporum f. sp. conglutinans race 2 54008 TaxID=1089457 RepID=X0HSH6_FUSOX|nr:hypothetical protein FOPG_19586 [Fusarium oxysporum f. sp. conglutinans race 2 54008]
MSSCLVLISTVSKAVPVSTTMAPAHLSSLNSSWLSQNTKPKTRSVSRGGVRKKTAF